MYIYLLTIYRVKRLAPFIHMFVFVYCENIMHSWVQYWILCDKYTAVILLLDENLAESNIVFAARCMSPKESVMYSSMYNDLFISHHQFWQNCYFEFNKDSIWILGLWNEIGNRRSAILIWYGFSRNRNKKRSYMQYISDLIWTCRLRKWKRNL
jgi:hypothetical protein